MLTARHAAIRLVKLMMVASVVLPAVLFAFAAWVSYRNFERVADERINRSLDILHEHALQTIDRTFAEIDEVIRGMSDDNISRNEVWLHDRLKWIVEALPPVQGIAIIDRDGHPLVSSKTLPVPKELNFSDRDHFKAQTGPNAGIYVSQHA